MDMEKLFYCTVYSLEGLSGSIPVSDRRGNVQKIQLGEKVILSETSINNLRNCVYDDFVAKVDAATGQLKSMPTKTKRFMVETLSEVQLEPPVKEENEIEEKMVETKRKYNKREE